MPWKLISLSPLLLDKLLVIKGIGLTSITFSFDALDSRLLLCNLLFSGSPRLILVAHPLFFPQFSNVSLRIHSMMLSTLSLFLLLVSKSTLFLAVTAISFFLHLSPVSILACTPNFAVSDTLYCPLTFASSKPLPPII